MNPLQRGGVGDARSKAALELRGILRDELRMTVAGREQDGGPCEAVTDGLQKLEPHVGTLSYVGKELNVGVARVDAEQRIRLEHQPRHTATAEAAREAQGGGRPPEQGP